MRSHRAALSVSSMPLGRTGQVRVGILAGELLSRLIALVLRHIDAGCRTVSSQAELRTLMREWQPEILIADLDLNERAPQWAKFADGISIPCVGLMRRRDAAAKLTAFEHGASDLIEVPFTPDEIVVRTIAALTRSGGRRVDMKMRVKIGRFELDLAGGIWLNDGLIRLTLLEQTLLYLFLANPDEVLGRDQILENIWGSQSAVTSNVIDRHIRDLRVKLDEHWKEPRFIQTVPGQGYRFMGHDGEEPGVAAG